MAVSDDHGAEWESQADVDACLAETGVTMDQVRRWRREGLLPLDVEQQWPKAYHGSETRYPVGTCVQIKAAQALFREKDRKDYVGLRLWRLGLPVDEKYWRPRLRTFGRMADWTLRFLRHLNAFYNRDGQPEALADHAARHPATNIILSRIKGRLNVDELAIMFRVLMDIGMGQFDEFESPVRGENRTRDEQTAIKAFDFGSADRHQVLGEKLNVIEVLPSGLKNAGIAFSIGNFTGAADAPAQEIAKARDDARNTFVIGWSLYDGLKWIYGEEAFGLRFVHWVVRKAPDALIDGLILGVLRLREVPNAIHSSEKIAEMAQEAQVFWRASKHHEWLWRNDPRFSEALNPKRIRTAFTDQITLKRWQEEVRRASMRQSNEILRDRSL
jgi:hypothetical protein